ncbi:TetR family transcriptional regulator [Roseobacter cerasinus]|uniref:TetR family transcriptional regulator n=1 Tax=Roseobacter cerasinus TaxID=2602289 RepID=A0A640VUY1_9RHOB|nr:TetR/AcrR family transcriptional regulator [Roseobacter cerasinus]GFE50705.1 TetR family transcriptional regulator [Roseobacter cerasinus]
MARTIAKDHDQKRTHILKTAARVFADAGFARASMSQIAAACGISKANIYHYYGSKDALLFDILDTYLSELRDRLCGLEISDAAPEGRLEHFVREALLAYEGMDAEHKIQSEGLPLLSAEQQEVLKTYQREMVRHLSETLHEIAPDAFDGDARRLRSATMSVFGMINWFYMWNPGADTEAREDYARLVATMSVSGVQGLSS